MQPTNELGTFGKNNSNRSFEREENYEHDNNKNILSFSCIFNIISIFKSLSGYISR